MKFQQGKLDGTVIFKPDIFEDSRGSFQEIYNLERYSEYLGEDISFVQDNRSRSRMNVLRGLHFQLKNPQGKLVRVTKGTVLDVVVDLRSDSSTYKLWDSIILSEDNNYQFWIPPGFAHGFFVMSDFADFEYKCTDYYFPQDEYCLLWNDGEIGIEWPSLNPTISDKDRDGLLFREIEKLL
tara:strand:+ start:4563 stop:5105 length:543 start_codon:yes stop_codon:yes gene_type:complete